MKMMAAVALVVAGASGRRPNAVAAGVAALLAAYLAEIVGSTAGWGRWLQEASPFHHLVGAQPAVHGLPVGAVTITALLIVAAVEVAARLLTRRDLVA